LLYGLLGPSMHALWQPIQDVCGFMHPIALVAGEICSEVVDRRFLETGGVPSQQV
ncbi:MAG: hypothetical protein AVDCRST_MAG58-1146, partial [uncultured Rubrobacteraceae bacterium]